MLSHTHCSKLNTQIIASIVVNTNPYRSTRWQKYLNHMPLEWKPDSACLTCVAYKADRVREIKIVDPDQKMADIRYHSPDASNPIMHDMKLYFSIQLNVGHKHLYIHISGLLYILLHVYMPQSE